MTSNRDVFVVVAAYNEGRVIRATVGPLIERGYSVVVVDDASTDDTSRRSRACPCISCGTISISGRVRHCKLACDSRSAETHGSSYTLTPTANTE